MTPVEKESLFEKAKKLAVKQKEKLEAGIGASIRDEDY
jgi:hypothetical protein